MDQGAAIQHTARRIGQLIRQRRALYYGARGLTWGLGLALVPVVLRSFLGEYTWPAAILAAGGGALIGLLYGMLLRVPAADAMRLADRAFGLHDRLGTAIELCREPEPAPLAVAAIEDAVGHAARLDLRRAVPVRWPRDVRLLPIPAVVLAALPYLPPIPVPDVRMPFASRTDEEEKKPEKVGAPQAAERTAAKRPEAVERVPLQEREYAQRQNPDREQAKGDLAAAFKDTNVASKRPDFSSFLKQGDDRIRVLERVDSLPDLQRDFTQSPYKVMFRRSRELMAGMDPRTLDQQRLRQLLEEMNRMGRRSQGGQGGEGDWSQELMDSSDALEQGQMGRALDAMERALNKMRAMDERDRGGRRLDGARDREGQGRDGRGMPGEGDQDFGEGQGSLPGKGTNPGWKGDPTGRLGQNPIDMGVEGQTRKGRKDAYATNMLGKGAQNPSRLPNLSVIAQYRKMMEDALAKESIPLDYRSQVRDYFQSLEER
jgi:hypothetical protein